MEASPTSSDPPSSSSSTTQQQQQEQQQQQQEQQLQHSNSVAFSTATDGSPANFSADESQNQSGQSSRGRGSTKRPGMKHQRSSGTIIVPREHPKVEMNDEDEEFDDDDARAMSPRRSSQEMEKMSQDARAELDKHAKVLQKSLLEIFNRIEAVKEEHDKLDNNNKFLQKYIGDLMSTSKITSTGSSGRKK